MESCFFFSSRFGGPVSNHIIMELPVKEASLEIVSKGGDFILMLSRIIGVVQLKSGKNTDVAWRKFVAIVMLVLVIENNY